MTIKRISILGSTGSVGLSTIDIIARHPDRFSVVGLSAGSNLELISRQAAALKPKVVSVKTAEDAAKLAAMVDDKKIFIRHGPEGAREVASLPEADMVLSAIVGAAGLLPTLEALKVGKTVGLANKESMVIAGELMNREAKTHSAVIIPVDSEHSALFQCLEGHRREDVRRLILTASGGPFLKRPLAEFSTITVDEALKHPNWEMGPKITIDSATMMNKGLEVMEARWLFDMPGEKIDVVIHPQSVIHSLVEYLDGSVLAQLGLPDMRVPIAYALSYPERIETGVGSLNLAQTARLDFCEPDLVRFPCLKVAFDVARQGATYPAVLNAVNEVVVDAFLKKKISFQKIHPSIDAVVSAHSPHPVTSLEDVLEADRWGRVKALEVLTASV